MINGVLVERTIKDVKPALQTNSDGLKKVLDDLVKQYKGLQDEMEKWKVRQSNPRYSMEITADMFIAEKEQCPSSPAMILRIPEFSLRMHVSIDPMLPAECAVALPGSASIIGTTLLVGICGLVR